MAPHSAVRGRSGVPVPAVFRVRIGAERTKASRNRDQPFYTGGLVGVHTGVANVEQRLPLLRSTRLCRKLRMIVQPRLDRLDVAEHQRGRERGGCNRWIERQQPVGATGGAAARASNEFVDRGLKRQCSSVDFLAQGRPGWKPVIARDHGLRVVEREIEDGDLLDRFARKRGQGRKAPERVIVASVRGMEQGLGLLLQLFEIRAIGQLARHRTTSMLGLWFASRQHGGVGAVGLVEI